jgi:hypothetical protein
MDRKRLAEQYEFLATKRQELLKNKDDLVIEMKVHQEKILVRLDDRIKQVDIQREMLREQMDGMTALKKDKTKTFVMSGDTNEIMIIEEDKSFINLDVTLNAELFAEFVKAFPNRILRNIDLQRKKSTHIPDPTKAYTIKMYDLQFTGAHLNAPDAAVYLPSPDDCNAVAKEIDRAAKVWMAAKKLTELKITAIN